MYDLTINLPCTNYFSALSPWKLNDHAAVLYLIGLHQGYHLIDLF